ncbi:MAG TPA: glycosyltransferase family 4 protein [Oligoflexia bacterium]|nr:glycosyltransferase family 4 protein [Oligoflexia bacterium]HMP48904.1 glycosyltransferase family 4 protein [Oligoflexia bacterium]
MKILFIASGCIPFDAYTIDQRPIGGIETGIIRLSECLIKLGHEVIIATAEVNPPLSEPLFIPLGSIELAGKVDALIAVRDWTPVSLNIPTKLRCFWTGDSYDQPQTLGIGDGRIASQIDILFCVSNWHKLILTKASGFPPEKTFVLRNAVHLPYYEAEEIKIPKRLIYTSTPYRGLKFLPEIFRRLAKIHPDSELVVCSGYDVYHGAGPYPDDVLNEFNQLKSELIAIPGCSFKGNLKQELLAKEFLMATILAYPNTFEETSCISVMEAKAAACIPITSARAALPETVGRAGICIAGEPGTDVYTQKFIEAIDSVFRLSEKREMLQKICLEDSKDNSWLERASQLTHALEQKLGM